MLEDVTNKDSEYWKSKMVKDYYVMPEEAKSFILHWKPDTSIIYAFSAFATSTTVHEAPKTTHDALRSC